MNFAIHDVSLGWSVRCSQFNHGWLRNRFCQSLKAEIQILAGKVGRDYVGEAHFKWLKDWLEHEETARLLIANFVEEMSPAALFAHRPLSLLNPDDASFFREMAHSHWLKRHQIESLLEKAVNELARAGECVRELRNVNDTRQAYELGLVASIHDASLRLADALSQLPRSIVL